MKKAEIAVARRRAVAAIYQDNSLSHTEKQKRIQALMSAPVESFTASSNPSDPVPPKTMTPIEIAAARRRAIGEVYRDGSLSAAEKQKKIQALMKAPDDDFAVPISPITPNDEDDKKPPAAVEEKKTNVIDEQGEEKKKMAIPSDDDNSGDDNSSAGVSDGDDGVSDGREDSKSHESQSHGTSSGGGEDLEGSHQESDDESSFSSFGGSDAEELQMDGNALPPAPDPDAEENKPTEDFDAGVSSPLLPLQSSSDNDEDSMDSESEGDSRRRRLCCAFWCLLFSGLTGFLIWYFLSRKDTGVSEMPSPVPTAQPIETPTIDISGFGPPSEEDCAAMALGLEVKDQESMSLQEFDVELNVILDSDPDFSLMTTLQENVQKYLVPSLAGCPDSQDRQRRLRVEADEFYVMGNGDVQFVREMKAKRCDPTTDPPNCYKWLLGLGIYVKEPIPELTSIHYIGKKFQEQPLVTTARLEAPFESVDAIFVHLRSRYNEVTKTPSSAPSTKPSRMPSFNPSSQPSVTVTMNPTDTVRPTQSHSPTCESERTVSQFFHNGDLDDEDHEDLEDIHTLDCPNRKKEEVGKEMVVMGISNFNCNAECIGSLNETMYESVCQQTDEVTFSITSEYEDEITIYFGYLNESMAGDLDCGDNVELKCDHFGMFFEKEDYEHGDDIFLDQDEDNDKDKNKNKNKDKKKNKDKNKDNEEEEEKDMYAFECNDKFDSEIGVLVYDEVFCDVQCLGLLTFTDYETVCTQAGKVTFSLNETYDPESLLVGYVDLDELEDANIDCESNRVNRECAHIPQYFDGEYIEDDGGVNKDYTFECEKKKDFGVLVYDSVTCEVQCIGVLVHDTYAFCADEKDFTFTLYADYSSVTLYMGYLEEDSAFELGCPDTLVLESSSPSMSSSPSSAPTI